MLIYANEMRGTLDVISLQSEALKLGHRNAQGLENTFETGALRLLSRPGNLMEEVSTERIVFSPYRSIWFANQLRNDVEIADFAKKISKAAETTVDVYLLKMSLAEQCWIILVGRVGSFDEHLSVFANNLGLDLGALLRILTELQFIAPLGWPTRVSPNLDRDQNIWILPG